MSGAILSFDVVFIFYNYVIKKKKNYEGLGVKVGKQGRSSMLLPLY